MATKEEITAILTSFIGWLDANQMNVYGPVFDPFLGTHRPRELHTNDVPKVCSDFADTYLANLPDKE